MNPKQLAIIAATVALAGTVNAQPVTSFQNLDFDAGVQNFPNGYDNPANDVPGWRDYTAIQDSGTEGPNAWWGTYENYAAFMRTTEGAYNLSDYTIQAGDLFSADFFAKSWDGDQSQAQWTVSFFYDTPANIIGSYTTPTLTGTWTQYSTPTPIAATGASEGGKLGVIFLNSGAANFASLDEVQVNVVPEPSVISLFAVAGVGMLLNRRRFVKA